MNGLTSDKPHLSGPKLALSDPRNTDAANNGNYHSLYVSERVEKFVRESLSENTRRAYASDLARFEAWGGSIPANAEMIAAYLTEHAASHACNTLTRWLASLSKAHRALGAADPTKEELTRSVLRGIRRRYGRPLKQAAPLTREILFEILEVIPEDLKGLRDRALLLIGFAGGFRRSELVGLEFDDVSNEEEGLVLTIRRSKTDQIGNGRKIGVPFARGRHCPVKALRAWIKVASIEIGPIFRSINRQGVISSNALSNQAVSLVIKERLRSAGLDPSGFAGHSLRSGFVTSAAKAGVSSWKIRQQTGHASETMLARYIRDLDILTDNAAGALL